MSKLGVIAAQHDFASVHFDDATHLNLTCEGGQIIVLDDASRSYTLGCCAWRTTPRPKGVECWPGTRPQEIAARDVRSYLNEFVQASAKPSYVNGQTRAVRTLLKFFHEEGYISNPVKFKMPPPGDKINLPYDKANEVPKLLEACLGTKALR